MKYPKEYYEHRKNDYQNTLDYQYELGCREAILENKEEGEELTDFDLEFIRINVESNRRRSKNIRFLRQKGLTNEEIASVLELPLELIMKY